MQAIGAAVDNIHSLDENLAPLLIDLGKAHSTSGMFDPSYFELFKVSCLSLKKKPNRKMVCIFYLCFPFQFAFGFELKYTVRV